MPLKFTIDPAMKLVPVSVRFTACPTNPLVGLIDARVGTGLGALEIVKTKLVVVPPPGAGLVTVTFAGPTDEMSVAGIVAVNCVALTNVVGLADPLKFTIDAATKFVPVTVSVKPDPPAVAPFGLSNVTVGTGLFTVNGELPDAPPPGTGFVTHTLNVPAAAMSAAAIDAVTCVAFTNVVVFAAPLKFTTAPETKFVPFTVSVNAAPPAVALDGDSVVIAGTGLFTANGEFPEVPPPGAGSVTVTLNVPAVAMSAAVIDAVTCVALTKVVVFAVPLNFTTAPETKFVPFTVRVNAAPPAVALDGESVVIVGNGLLTVNDWIPDVPPPGAGFVTVAFRIPAVAMSAAVTGMVTCVAFTNVVVRAVPLNVTTEVDTKLVPFTVSVNAAPPAVALVGEREVIAGTGLFTVNCELPDVPPPGAGLVTVALSVQAVAMSAAVA